jgi:hypothetical protein
MLTPKDVGELLQKHFEELTPEAFIEELRHYTPEALEEPASPTDIIHNGRKPRGSQSKTKAHPPGAKPTKSGSPPP